MAAHLGSYGVESSPAVTRATAKALPGTPPLRAVVPESVDSAGELGSILRLLAATVDTLKEHAGWDSP